MTLERVACITLDLENDWYFDEDGYDHLTLDHLDDYINLVTSLDVPLSIFAVGKTIEHHPNAIGKLSNALDVEFHLHSYQHDISKTYDFETELEKGIDAYRDFFGQKPRGYRAPQGNINETELDVLDKYGFDFDSSVFPSYRPGVYNNLDAPLTPYRPNSIDSLVEIPVAAVPRLRIPISQSYLKLLGKPYWQYLERVSLPDILVFDSHLQDFYRTASHDNLGWPLRAIHKRNLDSSVKIFREFIANLRDEDYRFERISDVYVAFENDS